MDNRKLLCKPSGSASADFDSIVDAIRYSVMIVNPELAILWRNRAAQRLLDVGDMLRSSRGQLRTADGNGQIPLREFLSRIVDAEKDTSAEQVVSLKCLKSGRYCEVVGFRVRTQRGESRSLEERAVVLLVSDPAQPASIPESVLESMFGLTFCERRLAQAMLNGSNLEHYAAESGISISTVRTHLKSIFRKTESGNQAALVSLLSRLVPPVDIERVDS